MRNLKLLDGFRLKQDDVKNVQCMTVDCDTGVIFYATDTQLTGLDIISGQVTSVVSLVDEDYLAPDGSGRVIGIQYLADQQALCVATSNGNLLLWNHMFAQLECVGSVESGFTAMSWSPDLELLVLTTGADTLIMMTREFDPVTETSLHPEQFGEAEFVNVGWGKKETQFHGSAGKTAATRTAEKVHQVPAWDDRRARISWRGDGQLFAISSVLQDTGVRKIHVWTRECVHQSTSENVDGIEQALAWRPSGSLIATSQRRPNKHDVAFLEKNGLRHGEFSLPFGADQVMVREVMWNLESTVLAVWCEDIHTTEAQKDPKTYVLLWTVGNYHWYLKQSLHFNEKVVDIVWDPEQAYRMHVMCSNGEYLQYTWSWATACSPGESSDDQALVAVIDGAQVLMTPMRGMVVPPPMSAYSLQLPCAVNQVFFSPPPASNDLVVVLVDGRVAVYRFHADDGQALDDTVKIVGAGGAGFTRCCSCPTLQGVYSLTGLKETVDSPLACSHFTWLPGDKILFTTITMTPSRHSILHLAQLDNSAFVTKSSVMVEGCVYGTACDSETGCVAVQLTDGSLLKYDIDTDMLLPWETTSGEELRLPVPCSQMAVCEVGGEMVVLGLTDRYRFYVNDTEVASNCTSFTVHDEFLLLTTLTHTCRCISRHTEVKVLPTLSDGKAHPFDEAIRRVERGSRIVTCVADDTKLVLQMPRGNLETIHPRALILSAVRKHLNKVQYGDAFMIMRKHRINMNLLYDHNPASFLSNVEEFIRQVEAVNHINLFLTDLLEEDVTATMYTAAYQRAPPGGSTAETGKVDKICNAVRAALYSVDENKYLLSILTTFVRKSRPDLQSALQLVMSLRESQTAAPHISAEEALKYLVFLVDVNELYDIALGTYDFDLVMMVAEKSQKDPKEYVPFLNQLRRLDTYYQRYTIDKHLKRFEKALENISKCGEDHFNECLTLVQEHRLYSRALQLYPDKSQQYKAIASAYGDYLSEKRRHGESGLMYSKAENWEPALKEYVAGNLWQKVFCVSSRLQYTKEQDANLARKMAENLRQSSHHSEAAILFEQYAEDTEEAIVTLIQGALWDESLRLMYRYRRTDFIETDLRAALLSGQQSHIASLDTLQSDFEKYKSRLDVVRHEKERVRLELLEGEGRINDADADLFSDTSSATGESIQSSKYSSDSRSSVYSKMSGRSQRNRRKADHKRWKLKEGSQYEDFALIAELAKIVKYVDGLRDEIRPLLKTLVEFHYDKEASELQQNYSAFLTLIDTSLSQIWTEEDEDSSNKSPLLGPDSTANTIAQAMQQGRSLTQQEEKLDPVIRLAPQLRKEVRWKLYCIEPADT